MSYTRNPGFGAIMLILSVLLLIFVSAMSATQGWSWWYAVPSVASGILFIGGIAEGTD